MELNTNPATNRERFDRLVATCRMAVELHGICKRSAKQMAETARTLNHFQPVDFELIDENDTPNPALDQFSELFGW